MPADTTPFAQPPFITAGYIEDFRRVAHQTVDWIADYLSDPRCYPVLPAIKPGDLIDALPATGPERGESFDAILKDFNDIVLPAVSHWNHPRFLAYFATSSSTPAILADMLATALNTNGLHWKTSPAVAELEQVALGWLRQWLDLPENFFGIIHDTASVASFHALAAAREMADPDAREHGGSGDLILYASEHAHASIEKAAIALGVGQRNVRKIGVDAEFRLRPDLLAAAIDEDLAGGKRPFCMVATVGTTSSASVDPVAAMAEIAERHDLWLHIDAAYAGPAAILPECRHILAGAERAHSLVLNPHKWMLTPVDLSAFYTRRPDVLRRAFSLVREYLQTTNALREVNLMDYGLPLGRRFRALKLWFVLRYFGREGIQRVLRAHMTWARELAKAVDADPQFERLAPVHFSVVCFRYIGTDEQNRAILDHVNASGKAFLSHTMLEGRVSLRVAIGNLGTTWDDVAQTWELVRLAAREV